MSARRPLVPRPCPALERWRRLVLRDRARRAPLEVAAAWELTAATYEAMGYPDGGDWCRYFARQASSRRERAASAATQERERAIMRASQARSAP